MSDAAVPVLIRRRHKVMRHLKIDELRSERSRRRGCASATAALAKIAAVKAVIPRCRGGRGESGELMGRFIGRTGGRGWGGGGQVS